MTAANGAMGAEGDAGCGRLRRTLLPSAPTRALCTYGRPWRRRPLVERRGGLDSTRDGRRRGRTRRRCHSGTAHRRGRAGCVWRRWNARLYWSHAEPSRRQPAHSCGGRRGRGSHGRSVQAKELARARARCARATRRWRGPDKETANRKHNVGQKQQRQRVHYTPRDREVLRATRRARSAGPRTPDPRRRRLLTPGPRYVRTARA